MRKYWIAFGMILLAIFAAAAGEILDGFFYTEPKKIYVNQPFEVHCKITVTFGSEIEDVRFSNFQTDQNQLELDQWSLIGKDRAQKYYQDVTVFHLVAKARGKKPFRQDMTPILHCSLVERRGGGFFSQWRSYQKRKVMEPFSFAVSELPLEGRPANFQGEIGQFSVTGRLSKNEVMPGDIITLRLELKGKGWMGNSTMPAPATNALFKTYPIKHIVQEPSHRVTEQVWIPNSTNAVEVGAVTFSFFNPQSGKYESRQAGPFPLTYITSRPGTNAVPEVKVIRTEEPAGGPQITQQLGLPNEPGRHLRPLLVFAGFLLVGFFALFQLVGRHTILGIILAVVITAIGAGGGLWLDQRDQIGVQELARPCEVYLAPSSSSVMLFQLKSGADIVPLERVDGWTRVESGGRRGWIHGLESSICR